MTESRDDVAVNAPPSIDLPSELIKRYKEDCEIRGMSPESLRRYISSLNIYSRYLQERNIDLLYVDRTCSGAFFNICEKNVMWV